MAFTPYPYPTINSIVDLFTYPTALIGDFWGATLITVLLVIIITTIYESGKATRIEEAAASGGFVTAIIAMMMVPLGIVTFYVALVPGLIAAIATMFLYMNRETD